MRRNVAAFVAVAALFALSLASTAQAVPIEDLAASVQVEAVRDADEDLLDPIEEPASIGNPDPWAPCGSQTGEELHIYRDDSAPCQGSDTSPADAVDPEPAETSPTVHVVDIEPGPTQHRDARPGAVDRRPASSAAAVPTLATPPWAPAVRLAALTAAALLLVVPWVLASKDDENEVRRRIYEMVVEDPGLTASAIADELDIHLTTAIYHLERLQDDDRVEGLEEGRSTLYFENHRKYGRVEKRVLTTLKKDTASDVLSKVAENPGIHCAELARRMDLSRTSIKWHTDRLADEGLLEKRPSGGTLQLEVPDRTEELLRKHRAA